MDKGVPELFTDTEVYVTIGDVSSNDGMPRFIRPEVNEIAFVPEVRLAEVLTGLKKMPFHSFTHTFIILSIMSHFDSKQYAFLKSLSLLIFAYFLLTLHI
jgi:hypothetical protein